MRLENYEIERRHFLVSVESKTWGGRLFGGGPFNRKNTVHQFTCIRIDNCARLSVCCNLNGESLNEYQKRIWQPNLKCVPTPLVTNSLNLAASFLPMTHRPLIILDVEPCRGLARKNWFGTDGPISHLTEM